MKTHSRTRRLFEWFVGAAVLMLPVAAVLIALDPGGAVVVHAASAQPAAPDAATRAEQALPAAQPVALSPRPPLSYRTSWIGNTWGYANRRWMQIDVEAIAVAPSGDVFTNALWDEGGGELGHYRDGQLVGYGGGSHGWGMLGGDAIAVNDRYVFAAQVVESVGNALAAVKNLPPEGVRWYGVTRRSRDDFTQGVPFVGATFWPGTSLAFRLIAQSPEREDGAIRGLAADNRNLFVSNPLANRIEIFDADSMQPAGGFAVRDPGKLAIAPDGSLWIIERGRTDGTRSVVHHARNGTRLAELALPAGAVPVDVALDARGRLLVADNGPRQQVLIFSSDSSESGTTESGRAASGSDTNTSDMKAPMQLTATLGESGGLYAGRRGATGPLRFNGLTGVGVDRAGNVVVSMNGVGPRARSGSPGPGNGDGAVLESYTPDGRLRFSLQGLLFVDGAQFVDGDPPSVYSGSKRFTLDLSRAPGREWSYAGYTVDRFRYPYDPFFHLQNGQRGTPIVRDVDGHRLMFTLDMVSSYLRIYRFAEHSETAIPAGLFAPSHIDGAWPPNQPARGEWIWRDTAGKGRFAADDFDQPDSAADGPRLTGWWVDTHGDVWQGTVADGIRRFPLQGFDASGNPVYRYASMQRFAMPAPLTRITRLIYDAATDTMFVAGSTAARPFIEHNWNSASSTLARYDHWLSGKPSLRYTIDLPDRGPPAVQGINGIAAAGDYLFAVETMTGIVRVYDRDTGHDIGRLAPGPEVGDASGMIDESMPITAHRLPDGEYLVFVEEDWHGKALMYRFTPPARSLERPSHSLEAASLSSH